MRLIDADKAISDYAHYGISHPYDAYDLEDILTECTIVEAIPKAEYEARLKADMVAMLEELQLEIKGIQSLEGECDYAIDECIYKYKVTDLIQEKINELKENTNE